MSSYAANKRITIMITIGAKTRVTGFHCRQLQKDAYKALKAFMALTGATTEEVLQTFIQFAAWGWQSPTHRCLYPGGSHTPAPSAPLRSAKL
jgi:hypothetical protein